MVRHSWRAARAGAWAPALATALPVLVTALVFAEFVQFNRHFFQAQARYFYPAHAAMAVLLAAGAASVVPPQRWQWVVAGGGGLLAALSAVVGWLWMPLPTG